MAEKGKKLKSSESDKIQSAEAYQHPTAESLLRPEVGTQPQFRNKKAPKVYRYDSSLSPEMCWDTNPVREQGEQLISKILASSSLEEAKHFANDLKKWANHFSIGREKLSAFRSMYRHYLYLSMSDYQQRR